MKTSRYSYIVLRHIAKSYGSLPGVWVGFFVSMIAYVLLYGLLAVVVAEFLLAVLMRTGADTGLLTVKMLAVIALSASFSLLGDYAFVRSTDQRYAALVSKHYSLVASASGRKLQAVGLDKVKNLFRDHMDGTIGILRLLRDDVLRILLACLVPAAYLATYDPLVGLLVAAIAVLQAWVALAAARRVADLRKGALKTYNRLTQRMFDALRYTDLFRIADAIASKREELGNLAGEEASLFEMRHRKFFLFEYVKAILTASCFALVFWITGTRYADTPEAAHMVILSAMYLLQAMQAASSSADIAPRLQDKWSNVAKSLELLDHLSGLPLEDGTPAPVSQLDRSESGVLIENLTFSYSTDEGNASILENISLHIPQAAHVAIVGANGSGKSTLLRIILGLEHPQAGCVFVDGRNIVSLPDHERAKLISWIPAGGPVIDGTVDENLRLFDPSAEEEAVQRAINISGLDEVLTILPTGRSSPVGDGGAKLSDGQKARLALARCLTRSSSLYLMDEPTANIDDNNAASILTNVLAFLQGQTVLAVIHSDPLLDLFPYVIKCSDKSLHWTKRPQG